ncbi:hypothetical protein ACWGI0_05740 [Streptomyces sp. NPDC054802]
MSEAAVRRGVPDPGAGDSTGGPAGFLADHYVGLWAYDDQGRRTDRLIDHMLVTRNLLARYRGSDPGSPR